MHRIRVLTVVMLLAFCLAVPLQAVLAAVTLARFEAKAQPDNTILIEWETSTELDTIGFRLYRAESASPDDWGAAIDAQGAKGNQATGAIYQYVDSNVTPGVRYYYLLEDISNTNQVTPHGPESAGINLPDNTPTPTGTATTFYVGPTATMPRPTAYIPPTDEPPPTATRQFTNTPAPPPSDTPLPSVQPATRAALPPTMTPLPAASINTPTRTGPQAPTIVVPAAAPLSPIQAPAQASAPMPAPVLTPTPWEVTVPPAGLATATPRPLVKNTPIIFEASSTEETPAPDTAATQSGRNAGLVLVVGGSAIGLAGLLAAVLLFVRARRP